MTEVIPAIIPQSMQDLGDKLGLVSGSTQWAQIDVCDGKLTPEPSWPHKGKGYIDFEKLSTQEIGIPHWEDFNFEIDLMITGPTEEIKKAIEDWGMAGAGRVIIHPVIHHQFTRKSEDLIELFNFARSFQMEAGLAIHLDSDVSALKDAILNADVIQCMGIEKIGFQSQPFSEKVFEKIEEIFDIKEDAIIAVDGGVNLDNAEALVDAGVTHLVAGSAIFTNADPRAAVEYLKEL